MREKIVVLLEKKENQHFIEVMKHMKKKNEQIIMFFKEEMEVKQK